MKGSGIQMKKNLEEMQVKVANKRAILESHDGEEFSLITVAKNVLCEDGTTMQDYFDSHSEPNISTKIVNSNSMSKVGQGDNVDFSDNVMNGAYEDVVLKGKSLVNVIQEPSSQDVVLPYAFEEGETVTINDTHMNGRVEVEVRGRTLVNVHQQTLGEITLPCDMKYRQYNIYVANNPMLVTNRTYLYILDIKKNTANSRAVWSNYRSTIGETSHISYPIEPGQVGRTVFKVNFKDLEGANSHRYNWLEFVSDLEEYTGEIVFTLNIIEYQEGMENWGIPYFEGMQSVKMPTLHTVGKNLINMDNFYSYYNAEILSCNANSIVFNAPNDWAGVCVDLNLKPNTEYHISYECQKDNSIKTIIRYLNDDGTLTGTDYGGEDNFSFMTKDNGKVRVSIESNKPQDNIVLKNIQLEQGSTATPYEPHKSSILSLPEEVVLRSLPNGVCDTFNTRTGVYTQRIEEIILNGEIRLFETSCEDIEYYRVATDIIDNFKLNSCTVNNMLPVAKMVTSSTTGEFVGDHVNSHCIHIRLLSSKLSQRSVSGVQEYLQSNPITVQYELATPIVTKINLPSTLKSWNTTTHIYSEIPENTLYPTLSHSNPTYPVIIKPSTKYSIVANSYSNGHTNSAINFNLGGATASTTVGNRVTTITTPSTLSNELLTMGGRGNKLNNVMVIEGDVVGDEPYFEGICDVKSPILSNIGKNLCNVNRYMLACGSGVALNGYKGTVIAKNIKVKPNTTYTFSYGNTVNIPSSVRLKVMTLTDVVDKDIHVDVYSHKNRIYEHTVPNGGSFTTEGGTRYIAITTGNFTTTGDILIEDIEIKETTSSTAYEPYKSNTTTFDQKDGKTIVLRSLPNGVCDTLNVKTGEYVQRIGEVVLDGSDDENWRTNNTEGTTTNRFISPTLQNSNVDQTTGVGQFLCDKLKTEVWNQTSRLGLTINGQDVFIYNASIDYTASAIKQWLSQNPVTVQYELATPIVKQVNVEGYPYAYENGHVLLESGSQEQSLTPTIEYSIVANRGGQIRSNQRMVERHQKKLDSLYAMTLVNMIDSQYKQVLMKLKSELGSEVRTWDIE